MVRSKFPSQNVQNTPIFRPLLPVQTSKSARCCGAKHISNSKSTFPTQNAQSTTCSDHFWKLRCRKSARRCPLWREAHVQVKMYKAHHSQTTFGRPDVQKVHAVVARRTFGSEKCQKPRVLSLFGRSDVEKVHTNQLTART